MTENTNENQQNATQQAKPDPSVDRKPEQEIRAEEAARRLAFFKEFMRENLDWLSKEMDLHRHGFSIEDRIRLNP